jgi:molecular chaperone GrpE
MAFKKKKKHDAEIVEDVNDEQGEEQAEEVIEDPLTKAERERDEAVGNWQRALADYKNLNRRSLETINSAVRNARTELLGELLLVIDYLDMALLAECTTDEARNLHFGVSLTRDQMLGVLERFEVTPITNLDSFDPTLHQAVAKVEDPEREEGAIVEVKRKGYMIGDKVLRHADVHVIGVEDPPVLEVIPDEDSAKSDEPGEGAAPEEEAPEA